MTGNPRTPPAPSGQPRKERTPVVLSLFSLRQKTRFQVNNNFEEEPCNRDLQADDIECIKLAENPYHPDLLFARPVPCCMCETNTVEATADFIQEGTLGDPTCCDAMGLGEAAAAEGAAAVVLGALGLCGKAKIFE